MKSRFNVRIPFSEDPAAQAAAALHVKEVAEAAWEAEVVAAPLPVVVHFHDAASKASEALAPRFAAVAEKFEGKARFVKVQRPANAALAARLAVAASPTVLFLKGGSEQGTRLSGEDIQRTALKAGVEALLGIVPAAPRPAASTPPA